LFADDTTEAFSIERQESHAQHIEEHKTAVMTWVERNGLKMNADKTVAITFCRRGALTSEETSTVKFLGVHIDQNLTFDAHVDHVATKVKQGIFCLRKLRDFLPRKKLVEVYHALIQSHLSYALLAWGYTSARNIDRLVKLQKWAVRTIMFKSRRHSCRMLFRELGILTLPSLYILNASRYIHDNVDHLVERPTHRYELRCRNALPLRKTHTEKAQKYIDNIGIKIYNNIPVTIKELNAASFSRSLTNTLRDTPFYSYKEFFEAPPGCSDVER
jgi:hypothetical protein